MSKYFVSFAHSRGFGNLIITDREIASLEDTMAIEKEIAADDELKQPIIISFVKLEEE